MSSSEHCERCGSWLASPKSRAQGMCGGCHDLGRRAAPAQPAPNDPVQYPAHYTSHPSGIECIEITRHMGFCLGNVVKYVWRADLKGDATEDLLKAREYLDFEIETRIAKKGTK